MGSTYIFNGNKYIFLKDKPIEVIDSSIANKPLQMKT
jgi:hypothetical protein